MRQAITTATRPAAPHIDPVTAWENYTRIFFEEDPKAHIVVVGDPHHSRRAAGLYNGVRIKTVLPAQDWPEEPITLNYYKTRRTGEHRDARRPAARPVALLSRRQAGGDLRNRGALCSDRFDCVR